MTSLRRYLVFQLLLVWQGGFLFYASFVVPVGTRLLGGAAEQGVITVRVTDTLNLLGVAALVGMAWDLNYTRDRNWWRTTSRWWCWAIVFVCQGALFFLHQLLDSLMDVERMRVLIRPLFRPLHSAYLITITVQWIACLFFAWFTLRAWQSEDRENSR